MHAGAHAFVLAGGRGTRFWPLSRHGRPKQFLDFTGEGPLLAMTLDRLDDLVPAAHRWVITGEDLVGPVRAAAPALPEERILAEPVGRNTAPAVALAACLLLRDHGDVPFVVLPSDHLIGPVDRFRALLGQALRLCAEEDVLVTFGVRPDRPETGYGYIEVRDAAPAAGSVVAVEAFREKPDRATAQAYVDGGRHFWNSGMFAWRASRVVEGLRAHAPEVLVPVEAMVAGGTRPGTPGFRQAFEEAYAAVAAVSIDYALMERASNVRVIPVDFQWNDVGHWLAMRELWPAVEGNHARGECVAVDARGNIVHGEGRVTALVGVDGLIVVSTADATLVCAADRAQDIKLVLQALRDRGLNDRL